MDELNYFGIIIGLISFFIIGLFHPLVIKAEYYIGTRSWWIFLFIGIIFLLVSLLVENKYISVIFGVLSFSSFWSIIEVFQQTKRVEKGWFPANPNKRQNKSNLS